jgi:CheY-like chemotaxis protein
MGLELAKQNHPDVIILDVIMPKIDGWTILNRLKEDPDLSSIPVIMSTFVNDKNVGYALGATDYLVKPISKKQIKNVLEKYVFPGHGGYILIVDDEAINRSVLHSQIEKVGLVVKEATNGLIALEMVKQSIPQLILLDLMMPEMDGFELIDQLRQNPQYQNIPIVVITAKDLTNEDRHRLSGYVQNVLQKGSYNRKTLLAEVNQILDEGGCDP